MGAPLIVFRTDASLAIGTGHVMRGLTLADALRERGARSHFICRAHDGNLIEHIRARGHTVTALPVSKMAATDTDTDSSSAHAHWLGTDWASDARETLAALQGQCADWLVVDHYALDVRWENLLRPACQQLLVIDDLADRAHDCELLLDQNLGRLARDYAHWVPTHCTVLAGPQYALLRPEFAAWRGRSLARRFKPQLQQLLITLGGVDKDNATVQVLHALRGCPLPDDCKLTVVMGPHAPWLADVRAQAAQMPWPTEVRSDVCNMAELMASSDLAIGAAGSTNWERCCLGLPSLLLVLADNQQSSADALAQAHAVRVLALASLAVCLPVHFRTLASGDTLAALGTAAQALTSGNGAMQLSLQMLPSATSIRAQAYPQAGETC